MTPTMVLGIGAPKAGTTWLHAYLRSMPGFDPGFTKEYHIWDAVFIPDCRRYLLQDGAPILSPGTLLRREMQRHPAAYFQFFRNVVSQPGVTMTADITPSYCGLGSEQLSFIYNGLKETGMRVKVVLLLRDPVERCWSMARMFRRDPGLGAANGLDVTQDDDALLRAYSASANARVRTSYNRTLAALSHSAIPRQDIYLGLYEEMFQPKNLAALCNFLGVPVRPELAEERVNASPKSQKISDETWALVARRFSLAYTATERVLPQARQLWPGFEYLSENVSAPAA